MKPFVLVVDDSLTVRMDLRQVLGNANFAVTACGTLTTARQVLHTRGCDLAIVDLLLPDGNGADLLREMRADPELRHIPVILISSMAQQAPPEDVSIDPELGADGYIGKPFDPQRIVRLAEEVCTANLGGKRFLLVDDSPTFSYALASILRQQGNTVLCVDTGEQALELLDSEPFDCVILDMVMPGIGGIETCRRLRQLRTGKDLPVVMLTANENTSGRSQGVAVGADNSLIGSKAQDRVGNGGVVPLDLGRYVVVSHQWSLDPDALTGAPAVAEVGAVTFVDPALPARALSGMRAALIRVSNS